MKAFIFVMVCSAFLAGVVEAQPLIARTGTGTALATSPDTRAQGLTTPVGGEACYYSVKEKKRVCLSGEGKTGLGIPIPRGTKGGSSSISAGDLKASIISLLR